MGSLMITAEAMQDFKSKIYGDNKKMGDFDQLLLVGAVASKKEAEIVFENSSSADEALRKLDALKIFCPRRDDDDGHSDRRVEFTTMKMHTLKKFMNHATASDNETGFNNMPTCDGKKVRAFEPKKSGNKSKKMKYSQFRELPEEFKRKIETMGGRSDEARLVFEKELYNSDVDPGASRLTMPINQLLWPTFLKKDEAKWLEKHGELHVTLIDPMVEEEKVYLARWKYNSCKSYVLRTGWNDVVKKNGLKFKDLVQVWSFRNKMKNRLHLALVKRGVNSNEAGCSGGSSHASTVDDGESSGGESGDL